jgi:Tfp pilus tip-associated adhesin PilY1
MWAFDVSNSSSGSWNVANSAPLFAAGTAKPITMKPLVVKPNWIADVPANTPNQMVYFGTGQYIAAGSLSCHVITSFLESEETVLPVICVTRCGYLEIQVGIY